LQTTQPEIKKSGLETSQIISTQTTVLKVEASLRALSLTLNRGGQKFAKCEVTDFTATADLRPGALSATVCV
jgi:hypothetical protein